VKKNNYVVILAGGVGSRLWPKSRDFLPKQFVDLLGNGRSLLQATYKRFLKFVDKEYIFVTTSYQFESIIYEQLEGISPDNVLLVTADRNTAPVIAYASFKIAALNEEANIIFAPSDHLILEEIAFQEILKLGMSYSRNHQVFVTLGILPTRADRNYGYIEFGDCPQGRVKAVNSFKEKPSSIKAEQYLLSGRYLWNSGMYICHNKTIIAALKKYNQQIYSIFIRGVGIYSTIDEAQFIADNFPLSPNISIDFAIIEKAKNVVVIESDLGWSDLGTWESLYLASIKDNLGNAIVASDAEISETQNCIIHIQQNKKAFIKGLDNFIIVDEKEILFIYPRNSLIS